MNVEELNRLFEAQGKKRWQVAKTTAKERIAKLKALRKAVLARQDEFYDAVWEDFHKPKTEAWITEVYPAISEINYAIKHLRKWMRSKAGDFSFLFPTSTSLSHFEPKGRVLIMAPWNYPFLLFLSPIAAAIAAGNVVIAKPSHKTPRVSAVLEALIADVFEKDEVAVVQGAGAELGDKLLALPFDHVFFTGSPKVGAHVAELAAKIHAGVTLELGGKSPTFILEDARIADTARKIAWGKCLNAGQTCIAPDYVLCPRSLVTELATAIADNIKKMYGDTDEARKECENFVHIVEPHAVERHKALMLDAVGHGATAVIGGAKFCDADARYTPATVLTGVTPDMEIMKSEIFGPILPIIAYDSLDDAIAFVQSRPKPLALYIFGKSKRDIDRVLRETTSGSTCVNHCILQIENLSVPFGGVGMSGTGNYHGFYGFKTFSHERNVMHQGAFDPLSFLYPPYHKTGDKGWRAKNQQIAKKILG